MKTKSFFLPLFLSATAFAFLPGCSGDKKEDAAASHEGHKTKDHLSRDNATAEARPLFQVNEQFQKQLSAVFASYVDLQEAFVSSDAVKVRQEAAETDKVLAKVDMKLVTGAAHNDWMNYLTHMMASLKEIQSTNDIEVQRNLYSILSDNLYKSAKAFGLGTGQVFYSYCPMAFNNEGAYWMSDQEKIRNPYFGDKMLTCGEVKEILR